MEEIGKQNLCQWHNLEEKKIKNLEILKSSIKKKNFFANFIFFG